MDSSGLFLGPWHYCLEGPRRILRRGVWVRGVGTGLRRLERRLLYMDDSDRVGGRNPRYAGMDAQRRAVRQLSSLERRTPRQGGAARETGGLGDYPSPA